MITAILLVVMFAGLGVFEVTVQRMGAKVQKQRNDLALKRITATRGDMGGGRIRKNPTY